MQIFIIHFFSLSDIYFFYEFKAKSWKVRHRQKYCVSSRECSAEKINCTFILRVYRKIGIHRILKIIRFQWPLLELQTRKVVLVITKPPSFWSETPQKWLKMNYRLISMNAVWYWPVKANFSWDWKESPECRLLKIIYLIWSNKKEVLSFFCFISNR